MKLVMAFTLCVSALAVTGIARSVGAGGDRDQTFEEIRDELWSKELAIYEGRSRGDLSAYMANTASAYLAWPPFDEVPKGTAGLQETSRRLAGTTSERLEMTFLDMALSGDTAVIYYKTHRTRLADGTPVDQHYEVTHTWIREDRQWKVVGGMARIRPER
jgi:ketosteroid isomerase-like protein